jgi:Xaa-Pro aminopeptidase
MLTMQPVVLRGRTGLSCEAEEFSARVTALQAALAHAGLDAAVAFGDARTYAPLTWICGLVPMLRWAVVVVPATGDPELYAAMPGARDLPRMRTLAAVGSVAPIAALPASLARFERVGLAGGQAMRAATESAIRAATEVVDIDQMLADLMEVPSPRERELLREAAVAAEAAASAALEAWTNHATTTEALLAADLSARRAGMHDVRILWSPDAGLTLTPLEPGADVRPVTLLFYLAVQTGGYWGEALRCSGLGQIPPALTPLARLGLSVQEGVAQARTAGFYSHRELDSAGNPSSWLSEVP